MSEYSEVKNILDSQGKKLDRLLSWAEGDSKLGTPSIAQQLERLNEEVITTRKRTYENENSINLQYKIVTRNKKEIEKHEEGIKELRSNVDTARADSVVFGTGGGGLIAGLLEGLRHLLT